MLQNRLRKHYLYAQNPGASLGPQPGLCPGPTGDLKRSPDPLQNFIPPNVKSWIRPCVRPSVRLSVCCFTSHWRTATLEAPLLPVMGSKLRHFFMPHLLWHRCPVFCCLIRRTVPVYCCSFSRQARVNEDIFLPEFLRGGPIWNKLFNFLI